MELGKISNGMGTINIYIYFILQIIIITLNDILLYYKIVYCTIYYLIIIIIVTYFSVLHVTMLFTFAETAFVRRLHCIASFTKHPQKLVLQTLAMNNNFCLLLIYISCAEC